MIDKPSGAIVGSCCAREREGVPIAFSRLGIRQRLPIAYFLASGLSLVLLAASAGGSTFVDPATLQSCEELADAGIALIQEKVNIIDKYQTGDRESRATGTTKFQEADHQDFLLSARYDEIGCINEKMAEMLADRAGTLRAHSFYGQVYLCNDEGDIGAPYVLSIFVSVPKNRGGVIRNDACYPFIPRR